MDKISTEKLHGNESKETSENEKKKLQHKT